ncbi:MAG: sulfurtransferase-like selenium metabolism protein YedF [Pseudomonadota bacterium]
MIVDIDAIGLACPAPVLKTKEAIEKQGAAHVRIRVDNEAAAENVSRFLSFSGFSVSVDTQGSQSVIEGVRGGTPSQDTAPAPGKDTDPPEAFQKIMVLISSGTMGHGDDELGKKLMVSFMKTLKEMGKDLWRLVFVNNGVKLTVLGSDLLTDIQDLEKEGVHVLVCGTCLTHFNLLDLKRVGDTTNMLDIVTSMQLADKVIQF